ncbi:MAG TPA: hypothetical protein VK009_07100 [Chloroflexota bacterium]|nr:hypothetical protein [Chloroflexota bacterium]
MDEDPTLEIKNMRLLGWSELNGYGKMGEGIAIQRKGNRRICYYATESGPIGLHVVDVTDPREPAVLAQIPAENDHVRFNSLSMTDDILVVARQTVHHGEQPAGVAVYDASDPEHLKQLSFFDTSGPWSRGCHFVWFVDGRYMHMSTGMPDFETNNPKDDQLYVIADLQDPEHPVEVGRWWLPGMKKGETPLPRHPRFDSGHRMHNVAILPSHPNRAYVAWLDSGVTILDTSDLSHPTLISQWNPHPPQNGFTHTAVPLFDRNLMVVSEESTKQDCSDYPKLNWIVDISNEENMVPQSTTPVSNIESYFTRGARFGAHNLHENHEQPTCAYLQNTTLATYFNGGVRMYDIRDRYRPEEIAYFVPKKPAGSHLPTGQINDVFVDEQKLIYIGERISGGLYILEYTGETPFD